MSIRESSTDMGKGLRQLPGWKGDLWVGDREAEFHSIEGKLIIKLGFRSP